MFALDGEYINMRIYASKDGELVQNSLRNRFLSYCFQVGAYCVGSCNVHWTRLVPANAHRAIIRTKLNTWMTYIQPKNNDFWLTKRIWKSRQSESCNFFQVSMCKWTRWSIIIKYVSLQAHCEEVWRQIQFCIKTHWGLVTSFGDIDLGQH